VGELRFFGAHRKLADPAVFADWLSPLRQQDRVIYAARPFAGPQAVLVYLSRYTHRQTHQQPDQYSEPAGLAGGFLHPLFDYVGIAPGLSWPRALRSNAIQPNRA
jgi:hypothetical protein